MKNVLFIISIILNISLMMYILNSTVVHKNNRSSIIPENSGNEFSPCNGPLCGIMDAAYMKDKTNREHAAETAKMVKASSDTQDVPIKIYYDNGALKEEGAGLFKRNLSVAGESYEFIGLEGSYKTYFKNGTLESDFNYFNKQPAGIAKMYYPSGNVNAEIIWVNDWVHGCCSGPTHGVVRGVRIFDETGKKISWNY